MINLWKRREETRFFSFLRVTFHLMGKMSLLEEILNIMALPWPELERYKERSDVEAIMSEQCAAVERIRRSGATEIHEFTKKMQAEPEGERQSAEPGMMQCEERPAEPRKTRKRGSGSRALRNKRRKLEKRIAVVDRAQH